MSLYFLQIDWLFRLTLACVLGVVIGFERKNRNKLIGVRTHAIVAFTAALMMIISKYGFSDIASYDAARIAAQIVSGVGFLGTGIIFVKDKNSVSGLTTAAGLWATAGVGMCVGSGLWPLAICSVFLLLLLQEALHRIKFLAQESYRTSVKITIENHTDLQELKNILETEHVEIAHTTLLNSDKQHTTIEWELIFASNYDKIELLMRLSAHPGVIKVRE